MKSLNILLAFSVYILTSFSSYGESKPFCTVDESGESSVFYCKDPKSGAFHVQEVAPIMVREMITRMDEEGIEYFPPLEFIVHISPEDLIKMGVTGLEPERECAQFEKIYYRVDQFNNLPASDATIRRLETLADALHEAGVCELQAKRQNFNSINIQSQEDLLHHFLCISNSESVFGRDNIGQGGRGPWGIHPMHNQKAGTKAFVDGQTVTLKRNGVCYPSKAVVRDSSGREIKESDRYKNYDVIVDNAKCAMTLYREKGFTDWGRTKVWGSNRHCSKSTRDRLQFFKHLGPKGCCTAACRARFMD